MSGGGWGLVGSEIWRPFQKKWIFFWKIPFLGARGWISIFGHNHVFLHNLDLNLLMSRVVEGSLEAKFRDLSIKIKNFRKKFIFWGPGAEFPYLGIIAKIHFSCIPWIAIALSNSTFINYVNITFPCWNGLIMQENLILAYYAQIWKFGPGPPKMEFFKIFSFLWKGLQILLSTSPQPPPDIKFKSSYARKRDFGLLCPNMEIRPQAPKTEFFKKFSFFWKGLQISLLTSPHPPADIRFKLSYARKHIKKVESKTQLLNPEWRSYQSYGCTCIYIIDDYNISSPSIVTNSCSLFRVVWTYLSRS